ncbi:MAG: hypothetical protein AB1641_07730 [Thermodesulfobacteriota bacterium]
MTGRFERSKLEIPAVPVVLLLIVTSGKFIFNYWYYLKYDWDTVRDIVLPLALNLPVKTNPYAFLLPEIMKSLAGLVSKEVWLILLVAAANACYLFSGVILFHLGFKLTRNRPAALLAAGFFLSSYCLVYSSSFLDDNVFQITLTLGSLAALGFERPSPARVALSGLLFALAGCFHFQTLALWPAYCFLTARLSGTGSGRRIKTVLWWAAFSLFSYLALLVLFGLHDSLFAFLLRPAQYPEAASLARGESRFLLLLQGAAASLIPSPVSIGPLLKQSILGRLALVAVNGGVLAVLLLALRQAWTVRKAEPEKSAYLGFALIAFACAALFALAVEPDGTERWLNAAPFLGLILAVLSGRTFFLDSFQRRPGFLMAGTALLFLLVINSAFLGKIAALVLQPGPYQFLTRPTLQRLANDYAGRTVYLPYGFEMVSFFRPSRTCYVDDSIKDDLVSQCYSTGKVEGGKLHLHESDVLVYEALVDGAGFKDLRKKSIVSLERTGLLGHSMKFLVKSPNKL